MTEGGRFPRLVINSSAGLRGTTLMIGPGRRVVGRAQTSDLRIADEHVSRTHAALESAAGETLVQDLGSSGGTLVNGVPLQGRRALHHGDLVRFGIVEARYEEPGMNNDETVVRSDPLVSGPSTPAPRRSATHYHIGHQRADQLSNVGGNQYNQYVQQIQAERASFFREVAAAKTRARRLIVVGFVLFLAGLGIYIWVFGQTAGAFNDAFEEFPTDPSQGTPTEPDFGNFFGPNLGGIPLSIIGLALGMLGTILMVVGLILHIVAASRRKSFDERTRDAVPGMPQPPQYR
jgi:hypothetical protein